MSAPPPPPYGYVPVPGSAQGYPPSPDERTWAWLSHASFFVLGIIGPLIVMLTRGKDSPFVRRHAVEALNFHLSVFIYSVVSAFLFLILIGILTLVATIGVAFVCTILAIVKAANGEEYRYPLCIRMVS
ncbi:MAG: hypothetical protein JWO46_510 [Nocardioidaceae bacterium]|nr:hypothetical protein [Nocardioidaceae bacterium]